VDCESEFGALWHNKAGSVGTTTRTTENTFVANSTQMHPGKVRAYLATEYRLGHTSQDIVLIIGLNRPGTGRFKDNFTTTSAAFDQLRTCGLH